MFRLVSLALVLAVSVSALHELHYGAQLSFQRGTPSEGFLECALLQEGPTQNLRSLSVASPVHHTAYEAYHDIDHEVELNRWILEVTGLSKEAVWGRVDALCVHGVDLESENVASLIGDFVDGEEIVDEVIPIVHSGDPKNRIDVVMMGDGYLSSQRQKMIDDMTRLTKDMFDGVTFSSYLPLFNVWAVFRPSVEEGIGTHSTPRNTAFRLYRQGTQLRGVFTGNPTQARRSCQATGPGACDFPSLIGNDLYYGGLGGEFTISTSSETSGTIVLRHELGHNLARVGEEYDGGQVYRGHNFAASLPRVHWRSWLTEPEIFPPKQQQSYMLAQDYAWYLLEGGAYTTNFTSTGAYDRWHMRFSVSGCDTQDSLQVKLDGEVLPWKTQEMLDRSFTEFYRDQKLSKGQHTLEFSQLAPPAAGRPKRQLCSVTIIEYKKEPEYRWDNDYVGAYPQWNYMNQMVGYRPQNEHCLMRNMSSVHLCPLCKEGIWHQFLAKISFIDDLTTEAQGANEVAFTLTPIQLAQFREVPIAGEAYKVEWTRNNQVQSDLEDKFTFVLDKARAVGSWSVALKFVTLEVRDDPNNRLTSRHTFTVS